MIFFLNAKVKQVLLFPYLSLLLPLVTDSLKTAQHGEELSLVLKIDPCDIAAITKSSGKTQTEE